MEGGSASAGAQNPDPLEALLAEKLARKAGTPIHVGPGIGSAAALLESQLLPLSFARSYWELNHDKAGCDDEPPPGATVPLRAVRESFMECFGFWPTASHPSPSVPPYQHTREHTSAEAAVVNEIEFCLFCLVADEEDVKNAPGQDAFPPHGYVSLGGIPWDANDFTNPW
jgi:hypothetical protein